jgi:hypothetical protein
MPPAINIDRLSFIISLNQEFHSRARYGRKQMQLEAYPMG